LRVVIDIATLFNIINFWLTYFQLYLVIHLILKRMKNPICCIKYLLFLVVLISCLSCSGDGEPDLSSDSSRTVEDVREDFSKIVFSVGINDITLESNTDGVFWNFRVIVPEGANASNKVPLIMSLHGGVLNSNSESHKQSICWVEPGFEELGAYIIYPNSDQAVWYGSHNSIQVEALVDLATSNFHINKNKVVVAGYSDGGNGSWYFAEAYPHIFSAAIAIASSYDPRGRITIPLYVIHGSADTLFPIERTESYVNESIAAGSDIQFIIADGLTHAQQCDYVTYLQDVVTWLETEVWD
jgi:predicted peptidase